MSQSQSKGGGRRDHKKAGKSSGSARKGSSSSITATGGVGAEEGAGPIVPAAAPSLPLFPSNKVKEANGASGAVPATTNPKPGQTTLYQTQDAKKQQQSGSLHSSETVAKHSSASLDNSLEEPSFTLQFGSISPGFVHHSGMQIPARTSSAPPNLDEQRQMQSADLCIKKEDENLSSEGQKVKQEKIAARNAPKSSTRVVDPSSSHITEVSNVIDSKEDHSNSITPSGFLSLANTFEAAGNSNAHDIGQNQVLYEKLDHKNREEHDQVSSKDGNELSGIAKGHVIKMKHSDSGSVGSETSLALKAEAGQAGSGLGEQRATLNSRNVVQAPKQGSKKKKKKELLAKADAAGSTADLYNAYKAPEDKKSDDPKPVEHPVVVSNEIKLTADSIKPLERKISKELDDWEDAAELSSPSTTFISSKSSSQRKVSDTRDPIVNASKYTRDFLLTFKDQSCELPLDIEVNPFLCNSLLTPEAKASLAAREASLSLDRSSDRQTTSGSLHERRGSFGDEHIWVKPPAVVPLSGASDFIGDTSSTSTYNGFRPLQNTNVGLLRMHPGYHLGMPMPPPVMSGYMPGPPPLAHLTGISPLPRPSGIDADRWQRAPGFQKGLIPSPQTPSATIHKAENRYEVGKVSDTEEAKQRQIKSILNKLTPQNFDRLFEQVKEVKIETAATLTGVISQIFDKALMEPTFCEMYAIFCFKLSHELPEFHEDGVKITFKRVLLNNCQEEFERGEREQQEAEKEEDGQVMLTKEEREEKKVKARRRMLGNIRFIGELYKKGMLTERIMHECIKKLLGEYQNPDEEDVEALCKLMATIGSIIDHVKAKGHLDAYFDRMTDLSNNKKLSSRLRFMLKDVIDLRKNEWKERRKVEGPKKIDEVHRDAAQERQVVSNRDRLTRVPSMGGSNRRPIPMNDFPARGYMPPLSGTLGAPVPFGVRGGQGGIYASYGQDYRMDDRSLMETRAMPMPLLQRPNGEGNVTLGPQGGLARGYGFRNQPSVASGWSPSLDVSPAMLSDSRRAGLGASHAGTNVSIMQDRGSNDGRHYEDFLLRPSSADRMHLPAERSLLERPHTSDRYGFSSGRDLRGIDRSFSDRSIGMLSSRPGTPPSFGYSHSLPSSPQVPSDEELIRKCKSAILEYYSARDLKEAAHCVDDLRAPLFHSRMLSIWVSDSLEKKESERDLLVRLLVYLRMEHPLLTLEQLIQGFQSVLCFLEDTKVDVPKAPSYIAGMIGKLLAHDVVSLRDVGQLFKEGGVEPGSLLETGDALNMLADVLDALRKERGEATTIHTYEESGLSFEDFIVAGEDRIRMLDDVLGRTNLQILLRPMSKLR